MLKKCTRLHYRIKLYNVIKPSKCISELEREQLRVQMGLNWCYSTVQVAAVWRILSPADTEIHTWQRLKGTAQHGQPSLICWPFAAFWSQKYRQNLSFSSRSARKCQHQKIACSRKQSWIGADSPWFTCLLKNPKIVAPNMAKFRPGRGYLYSTTSPGCWQVYGSMRKWSSFGLEQKGTHELSVGSISRCPNHTFWSGHSVPSVHEAVETTNARLTSNMVGPRPVLALHHAQQWNMSSTIFAGQRTSPISGRLG